MGWIEITVTTFIAVICIYVVFCFSWPETVFVKTSQRKRELIDDSKQDKESGKIAV